MKPWAAGDPITWQHFYPDGRAVERAGRVWDRAPTVDGATSVAWVIPDEPLFSDLYAVIAVDKASCRYTPVHGRYLDDASAGHWHVGKGAAYSSNYAGSPLGNLAVVAARRAHQTRAARERAA